MSVAHAIVPVESVKFKGHLRDGKNLSAVGLVGNFLLVAGDEDDCIQILRRDGKNYELLSDRTVVLNTVAHEADIEGIACDGDTVYAIGSHACTRPKPDAITRAVNRSRFESPEPPSPFRSVLARFRLLPEGSSSPPELATLRALLDATQVLRPFTGIPCKENGIDIEGLAIRDGRLYVGFRGPVLQHGFVPVLTCAFADAAPGAAELVYLNLGGRGVRDIERVQGGFLVLAGPVNDIAAGFELYFWDGHDCMPGTPAPSGRLELLGSIPTPEGAKAEGLAVEEESTDEYTLLVLFDGLKEGGPTRFRVRK